MKRKFIILSIIIGLLSACQKYETPSGTNTAAENEKVTTVFTLSPQLTFQAGYEPMSKANAGEDDNETKFFLRNKADIIIAKNIDSRWIVDTAFIWLIFSDKLYADDLEYKKNTKLKELTVTLRPGQYRIAIFLNRNNGVWNNELIKGTVIDWPGNPDFKRPFALRYGKQPENATHNNRGMYYISHEVFAGTQDFEVKKTTDVHSQPEPNRITVPLTRKVSKLNFALNNTRSSKNFNFGTTENWIYATLKSDPSTGPFCNGIDVWGNPWYDPQEPLDSIQTCVTMYSTQYRGTDNNLYLLQMKKHSNIWAPYFFSDPEKEYRYSLENVHLTGKSGENQHICKTPISLTMKHNFINGVIFKCTDESIPLPNDPQYNIITIIPVKKENGEWMKPTDVFDSFYYEYNH